jgi:sugar PTS system EIIA component
MFDFLRRSYKLIAPVTGTTMELSEVPDEIFAQKMAGDGLAIASTGDVVVAPADGELSIIFRTNHAFGVLLDNGVEILVHIGIDTIGLQGKGFKRIAEEGQRVRAGDPVIRLNREFILEKGYSLVIPVLITNVENVKCMSINSAVEVEAGKDIILEYKLK